MSPLMNGSGESSDRIVPTRSANKAGGLSAEPVEGRRSAKETPRHGPMLDTRAREHRCTKVPREHVQPEWLGRVCLRGGNRVR